MDLKQLKSGSDIRGTAGELLNEQTVAMLGTGFAAWAKAKKIAIGHDSRLSGPSLSQAAAEALIKAGIDVDFCGLCSTPSMFMATVLNGADGAIMFTASHHPKDKNGMKFFTKNGGVTSKELDQIIELAQNTVADGGKNIVANGGKNPHATYVEKDFLADYCAHMRQIFIDALGDMPLKGFKIAVDAGCGSSGFYAERILAPLGADVSGSQFLNADGNFPAHAPNPEDASAMESISKRVVETKSDLGVIFDADGDRAAIVLGNGTEVNRNRLIALISAVILKDKKGAHIVTDSVTSEGLREFITSLGGVHVRYKRGYQNVISYAKKLNAEGKFAPLAIETSGHAALIDNYFLDDGAYLCALLIIEAVKCRREKRTLIDLIKGLKEPLEEKEFRLKLTLSDWRETGEKALNALKAVGEKYKIATDSHEGIRVYTNGNDFFMARMSVHDPIIPVNIESYVKSGAKEIARIVFDTLKDINGIDLQPLSNYIQK